MLGLMGFSGSLPLYVIHRYYIFVFIDRANKDACLLVHASASDCCLPVMTREALHSLIQAFVHRRLDYCNSALVKWPKFTFRNFSLCRTWLSAPM